MKKLICITMILCILPVIALADVDLSSLTYDELLALRDQLNGEIISRPEWKEVTVPSGIWYVGKDIPVGSYSIKPYNKGAFLTVENPSATFGKLIINQGVRNESNSVGKVELKEGYIVTVDGGSLIFTPPESLGF